jgi:hypothetical protein
VRLFLSSDQNESTGGREAIKKQRSPAMIRLAFPAVSRAVLIRFDEDGFVANELQIAC